MMVVSVTATNYGNLDLQCNGIESNRMRFTETRCEQCTIARL